MAGTTDTVKAILTPGEFVIRKEAVDMIGVPTLEKLNNMPEAGGHSEIDRLIARATLKNMTGMYGGGEVKTQQYGHGGQVQGYQDGGNVLDEKVKFMSDLLNKENITKGELMNLGANIPKDSKLVGYDDIFNLEDPEVQAREELANTIRTNLQSEFSSYQDSEGRNEASEIIRQQSPYSVVGDLFYSNENRRGYQKLLDGIPMLDPITVTPEGATTDYSTSDSWEYPKPKSNFLQSLLGMQEGGQAFPEMALRREEPTQFNPEFVNVEYELNEDPYDKYSRVNRLRPFLENQLKYTDETNIYRKALEPFSKARYEGLGEPLSAIEEWAKRVDPEGDFNEGEDVDRELYKKLKKADVKLQRSALTSNRQMGQMIYQANRGKPIVGNFDQPLKDYTKASKEFEELLREIIRRPVASKALDESFNEKLYNKRQKGNPFYGDYDTSATGERYEMQNPKSFLNYRDQPVLDVFENGGLIGMMKGGMAKKKKKYGYQEGGSVSDIVNNALENDDYSTIQSVLYDMQEAKGNEADEFNYNLIKAIDPNSGNILYDYQGAKGVGLGSKGKEMQVSEIDGKLYQYPTTHSGGLAPSIKNLISKIRGVREISNLPEEMMGYQEGGAVQEDAMMQQYLQSLQAQQPQANPFVPFDQRPNQNPATGNWGESGDYMRSLRNELEMENEELIRDKAQNTLERIRLDSLLKQGAERIESLPDTSRFMPSSPFNLGIEI